MSEYIRYDRAGYFGSVAGIAVVVPSTQQLNREGFQSIDCRHFNTLSVQLSGTWVATVVVEQSNDGVNYVASPMLSQATGTTSLNASATGIYVVSVNSKYVRVRVPTYTSGTVVASVNLSATVVSPVSASQTVAFATNPTVNVGASTAQGASSHHNLVSAASTNATSVKGTAAVLNTIYFGNNAATHAYVKIYDKATAPVVGTDTPVMTIMVPANGVAATGAGYVGIRLTTGLAYAITGGAAVADTTAVAAGQVTGFINYT